jgi:beta-aspartyl-peptidase (threonine type)
MRLIAHGGAGSPPADAAAAQAALVDALAAGEAAETPVDAVVAALSVLESDPQFNAGVGSAVQSDGTIRTDAGLMTDDRTVGAAAAMPGVEHATAVARLVATETPHIQLAGDRAVDFASAHGVATDCDLWTDRTRDRWAGLEAPVDADPGEQLAWVREQFGTGDSGGAEESAEGRDHDTVGAVATDGERLAAATSTGGRWCALAGRVGDVPQVGSGFFATPAGGASATGAGEDIARVTLARRAVDHLEVGRDPGAAAELAVEEFDDITGSTAGVVVMDRDGRAGHAKNSAAMPTASTGE